jgi:hypothetical protein
MKNIYEQFINYLKEEEKKLSLKNNHLEKHHILPLHTGGKKDGQIVLCTSKNHTLAHYYRYLVYKERGYKVAYIMRWNQKIGNKERALLAVEKNKKLKNLFWNSQWQSNQGKKGGQISGQKNSLLYRQGYIMKETIKRFTYWEFIYNNQDDKIKFLNNKKLIKANNISIHESNNKFVILKIEPQITYTKLTSILNNTNLCPIKDVSSFAKIARGQQKKYYNWQLVAIEINWDLIELE